MFNGLLPLAVLEGPFSPHPTMTSEDTAISHLLSNNLPPSSSEATYVREQIHATQREANLVQCELKEMEHKIRNLQSQKANLDDRLEQYRNVLSPCRRMPVEILSEIFAYLVPEGGNRTGTLADLCRVCKTWRDAAFLSSRLWSKVAITPHTRLPHESISLWLSLAKASPKALYLYGFTAGRTSKGIRSACEPGCHLLDTTEQCCAFAAPGLLKLMKNGPSLDTLSINTYSPHCFQAFSAGIDTTSGQEWRGLERLKSLVISAEGWLEWVNLPPSSFLFIPPSVQSLKLDLPTIYRARYDVDGELPPQEINIPPTVLGRLHSLQLKCDWTVDFILKLLQHCSSLRTLDIDFDDADDNWTDGNFMALAMQSGIELTGVENVTFRRLRAGVLEDLALLRLPSILKLSITFGYSSDEDWEHYVGVNDLATLLMVGDPNRKPTLRSLSIARSEAATPWVIPLFDVSHAMCTLTELTLDGAFFERGLFHKLL